MKIIKRGKKPKQDNTITTNTYRIECQHCNSIVDVEDSELLMNEFSYNNYVLCPVCESNIVVEESDRLTTEELKYIKKNNLTIRAFSVIYLILMVLFFLWLILK